jgi:hypothetical protein
MKAIHTSQKLTKAVTTPTPKGIINNPDFYKQALKKNFIFNLGAHALRKLTSPTQTCIVDKFVIFIQDSSTL